MECSITREPIRSLPLPADLLAVCYGGIIVANESLAISVELEVLENPPPGVLCACLWLARSDEWEVIIT